MPFVAGARPVSDDIANLLVERTWVPQLAITGIDGLPPIAGAGAVMLPFTAIKVSLRLPPTLDPEEAAAQLKALLEADPPYGSQVSFDMSFASPGWHAPETAEWLAAALKEASFSAFGLPPVAHGGGGGIPFLNMLGLRSPKAQFLVTGVLGPQSNAHGPNEFLDLPTARAVTVAVALVLAAAARN